MKPIIELLIYKYFSFFVILLLRRELFHYPSPPHFSSFVDDFNLGIIILLKRNGLTFYSRDFLFYFIFLVWFFQFFQFFFFFHL
jgi:hypothetical protein